MQKFGSPAITELARQLRRGPTRLRLRQLLGVEFLLTVVEPGKAYPADFVCHVLTGFSPVHPQDGHDGHLIDGDTLVGDLVMLAECLSDDAHIAAEHWDGVVYSITELAERFDVSTKTIFRWRRRGLVGWKLRFPDRRARVVFPDRCIRRFVAQNAELVHRGTSFSQLTQVEKQNIIDRARALLVDSQMTINALARQLAAETGRAVETIRLILKSYDEAHPQATVFRSSKPEAEEDEGALAIWEAYQDGASLDTLSARFGQPVPSIYRLVTRLRARELQSRLVEFVDSPEFRVPDADEAILRHPDVFAAWKIEPGAPRRVPADLPPYLQQLFRMPLLTREGEAALFRKMNYLKFKADQQRKSVDPETVSARELDQIEALLDEACRVKNQITQANLRLVVSVAKRHINSHNDFFEIVSDGNISLIRAIEKFDYSRGFKFSTYASWAIMRNFARSIPEQRRWSDRYQTGREEALENIAERVLDERDDENLAVMRRTVESMLDTLDERERCILRQRFGLDGPREPQTLEQIGRRFGVSKERVRQIESRAIVKLRSGFQADRLRLLGA